MKHRSSPLRGLLHPACGPVLSVTVRASGGAKTRGLAVLDTGASLSAIDREVALGLALPTHGAAQWSAISALGPDRPIAPLRTATLSLADDPRLWELELLEIPGLIQAARGSRVVALIGWNFLDQCVLSCDGPSRTFSLTLPDPVGSAHRRR